MSSTIRCGACSTFLTLLVSSDSAGGGPGRARVVSRRRVLFSFFSQNYSSDPSYLLIRIDTYQSDMCYEKDRVEQVTFTPFGEQVAFTP